MQCKLCYLITEFNTGGAQVLLYEMIRQLNKSKFSPVIISILPIPPGPVLKKTQREGIPLYSLNMRSKFDIRVIWKLYRLLKQQKPDILHTQLFHANFLGRVVGCAAGVPLIISSIHNTVFGSRFRELLLRWTDRWAVWTTAICRTAGDRMIRQGVVPESKLKVIFNGINLETFDVELSSRQKDHLKKSLNLPGDRPLLLTIGRLTSQKGYRFLINAISLLKKTGQSCCLAMVGEGELQPLLERQVKELGLDEYVYLLGLKEDIPQLMAAADIFVLSSLWEGLPVVILEAMAAALPVISTSVGGAPELVVDGETGLLVPPGNPAAMSRAITNMLAFPAEKRLMMGLAGKKIIAANFTLEKMVAAYEELYARGNLENLTGAMKYENSTL